MGKVIAVTGKGGVGKTAVATMAVRALLDVGAKPILAVDADPNANFHTALGVQPEITLGSIREAELRQPGALPAGMSKPEYFAYRTQQALVEAEGFDFLAMGRPEGPGCYCFANSLLRDALSRLEASYAYIVVDCEAGLEHFSRRTASHIDLLIVLADISRRALETVKTVLELAASLHTPVGEIVVAINRVTEPPPAPLTQAVQELGLQVQAYLPEDPLIAKLDLQGQPLLRIDGESALRLAVRKLLARTQTLADVFANAQGF